MKVSNIFSKSTGPDVTKFFVQPPLTERMKIYTNCHGHMTNIIVNEDLLEQDVMVIV